MIALAIAFVIFISRVFLYAAALYLLVKGIYGVFLFLNTSMKNAEMNIELITLRNTNINKKIAISCGKAKTKCARLKPSSSKKRVSFSEHISIVTL